MDMLDLGELYSTHFQAVSLEGSEEAFYDIICNSDFESSVLERRT